MQSTKFFGVKFVSFIPFVAGLMILIMVLPSSLWSHPINDAEYHGFDPNLIYLNENGGLIRISNNILEMSAIPETKPTVHLLTTPFNKLKINFDVRILTNEPFTYPLRIDLWSARNGSSNFIEFGSSPNNLLRSGIIIDGKSSLSLTEGSEIKSETMGTYDVGRRYNVEINMDKENGTIITNISAKDNPPTGSPMLRIDGTKAENQDVSSELIPVEAGKEYEFGGLIKSGYSTGVYKLDIQWLDEDFQHISFYENWQSIEESDGWRNEKFIVSCPERASYSRVLIGAAEGDQIFFANLFFNEENSQTNLIKNGDFTEGFEAWTKIEPLSSPEILDPFPPISSLIITADEIPQLFNSLRISLTLTSNSRSAISKVLIDNYTVILPHQKWQTNKVDDFYLKTIILILIIVGVLLLLKTGIYGFKKILKKSDFFLIKTVNFVAHNISLFKKITFFFLIYLLLNAFLFNLGNLPFDMFAEKFWTYIIVKHSPMDLYYLPNLVTLAEVWGGIPLHEAIFPYNFGFGYLFTFIGLIYKFFLNGPGDLIINNFSLEATIKSANILFVLLDGLLIYLIIRKRNLDRKQNIIASALFFMNPAVLFLSSIWGSTHAISIFFLLAAIWTCENQQSIWTWIFLALGVINRPQMLIPSLLLTIVIFKKFSWRENLRAISISIIIVFLLLAPFSLAVSPTLPFDVLTNVLSVQELGMNELALTTVSLDTFNFWPLITYVQGARGLDRIFFPSSNTLVGNLSYIQISQILVISLILISSVMLLKLNKKHLDDGKYFPILAFGTVAFFVLKTGLAATHFILALPLIILCRKFMRKRLWYCIVIIWTITTLIPMYGALGFAIEQVEYLAPVLNSNNNPITRFFMNMFSTDWVISLGSLANFGLLVLLAIISILQIIQVQGLRQLKRKK